MKMPSWRKPEGRVRPNGRIALGLLLIGTGRPAGFAQFGRTLEAFGASLAPLLGFLIVLTCVIAVSGHPVEGLAAGLEGLCALLAPAVIAELFCLRWQRTEHWAMYANVLNCAQWLMLTILLLLLPVASVAVNLGLPVDWAGRLAMAAFAIYALWFHWFAARHVLKLSGLRALAVMLGVVFGTGLLLQVPPLLGGHSIPGAPNAARTAR